MDNPLQRRSFSLRRILIIMAIALAIVAVLAGFAIYALIQAAEGVGSMMTPAEFDIDKADIKSYIGVSFPGYASDFHAKRYGFWRSRMIAMRVTVPPEKLDDFLNLLGNEVPLQVGINPLLAGRLPEIKQYAWWNPDGAKLFLGGSFTISYGAGDASFYDILVDKTPPEQCIVYLIVEQG